jgi:hypothetical protein
MRRERTKFYDVHDLSNGINLTFAQSAIRDFRKNNIYTDINDIIELFNISLFFKNGLSLPTWSAEDNDFFSTTVKEFPKVIGRYFSALKQEDFIETFASVDILYTEDFWRLIDHYKVYTIIDNETFEMSFSIDIFRLHEVLEFRGITYHYGNSIRKLILSNSIYAELIMNKFLSIHVGKPIFFPKELSLSEMEDLIIRYIESSNPNINYISLIANSSSTKEFPINDSTKLMAKRRYRAFSEDFF